MEEAFEQEPPRKRARKKSVINVEPNLKRNNHNEGVFPALQQHLLLDYGVGSSMEVLPFDYSVQNHFEAMDAIAKLCGEDDTTVRLEDNELETLASNVTFLREWRHLNYGPKTIKVAPDMGSLSEKAILSQFSSSTVPKENQPQEGVMSRKASKDFVMYVGGLVWALDWCPLADWRTGCQARREFIAVAAHPPGSSYHKLGCPITGRGVVQIWSLLNIVEDEEAVLSTKKNRSKKSVGGSKPRGRPRKKPVEQPPGQNNHNSKIPEDASGHNPLNGVSGNNESHKSTDIMEDELKKLRRRPRKKSEEGTDDQPKKPRGRPRKKSEEGTDQPKKPRGRPRKNSQEGTDQPKKPRGGRTRKKTLEEPPDVSDLNSQVIAVQFPDEVLDAQENTEQKESGKDQRPKTSRRRTRKKCIEEPSDDNNPNSLFAQALAVQFPEVACGQSELNEVLENAEGHSVKTDSGNSGKSCGENPSMQDPKYIKVYTRRSKRKGTPSPHHQNDKPLPSTLESLDKVDSTNDQREPSNLREGIEDCDGAAKSSTISYIGKDVALPRLVLCLAHNGKVAWDVKWRPTTLDESKCMQTMGYLAVILGNGSLEVWEVPLPSTMKRLYSCMGKEGTDPRFVKLEPVFRSSMLKSGGTQSIPMTVEWSSSPQQEYLLAGCHDGTVALWKFCLSDSTKDTRPLLCFSADTDAIRSLAWSPSGSDIEGANVIVTAGQGGIKFWDLRDPFRPLWEIHPVPRHIYSLDWVPDLRCVIMSFDDGSLKFISLSNSAYDVPVTGKPLIGTKYQGLHSYHCSSYPIWSVHVSRGSGMVAYSCANGSVCYFQLTPKAVDKTKSGSRYRAPHYLCLSMTEEEDSTISIKTGESEFEVSSKKPFGETLSSGRAFLSKPTTTPEPKGKAKAKAGADGGKSKGGGAASNDELLALCYGDEPSTSKSKKTASKSKTTGEEEKDGETFPAKVVGMHRVRWNMNKGSERWLCYGGAAGLLRCQQIDSSL